MKKIIKVVFFLVAGLTATAQSEFSLFGSGGISTLLYSPTVGEKQLGFGGNFGLNYNLRFSENWSLKTGVGVAMFNSTFSLDHLETRSIEFDAIENTYFELRTRKNNYSETLQSLMLQIPLMLQGERFLRNPNRQFYTAFGVKLGIPLSGTYRSTVGNISHSGFFSFENNEYRDFEEVGFGTFSDVRSDGTVDFNLAIFASAEVGMRWWLNSGRSLYTGVFVDFGLNSLHIDRLVASSVRPMTVGLTLRFSLNRDQFGEIIYVD